MMHPWRLLLITLLGGCGNVDLQLLQHVNCILGAAGMHPKIVLLLWSTFQLRGCSTY